MDNFLHTVDMKATPAVWRASLAKSFADENAQTNPGQCTYQYYKYCKIKQAWCCGMTIFGSICLTSPVLTLEGTEISEQFFYLDCVRE